MHRAIGLLILEQEQTFPELLIYPASFFSRLGDLLGFHDIDFESAEFSRAFVVRSPDKKFAYDICHGRMIEYLLEHRDLRLEIENHCIAMVFDSPVAPEQIPGRLRQLVEIRNLVPQHLCQEDVRAAGPSF